MPLPKSLPRSRSRSRSIAARAWVALLLSLLAAVATAQPRAWLDRNRIGFGETVTLNIETTGSDAPDYAPLQRDFSVSGNSSSRRLELGTNGNATTRSLFAVALRPRRDGQLTVPSLRVGSEQTAPLSLQVAAASASPAAHAGDDVFIESLPDDVNPYVQQAVGWVVRLYAAVPLVSGQLDQDAPEGASMQRIGDDAQYSRDIGSRRYTVVERRFLLVPERSGVVMVPGASFEGRGAGGFFDDVFGSISSGRSGGALATRAPPRRLQVRAIPANAPQPWLPLHGLQLRYKATPQALRAGSAATLTIEATADGATAAQMPELQLPAIDGVQVFAEPVQADESFASGRPRVKLTRAFSLVPARAGGSVHLSGLRLGWWDVQSGSARVASLADLDWPVGAGNAMASPIPDRAAGNTAFTTTTAVGDASRPAPLVALGGANRVWVLAALLFAALWLFTLVWALQHRARSAASTVATTVPPDRMEMPGKAALKRVLEHGDFADVTATLCAMARPVALDADEVLVRLADAGQRDALAMMQRARWGDGDGVAARAALRSAFAGGPRWRSVDEAVASPLPPLYPRR